MPKMLILFDFDGTICDNGHRQKEIHSKPRDWSTYNYHDPKDLPKYHILRRMNTWIKFGAEVVILTGRLEWHRKQVVEWLKKYKARYHRLVMRPNGDLRDDHVIKEDLLKKLKGKNNVMLVYEDKPSVIDHWRSMGLDVIDCGDGKDW